MKKSSFVALLLGTVSGVLFALGMCMALVEAWGLFGPGVALGGAGLVLGLVTVAVWRRMEHRPPVRFSGKAALTVGLGLAGTLALGVGMCCSMVWGQMAVGIAVGLGGILILLCLIPLTRGIRD